MSDHPALCVRVAGRRRVRHPWSTWEAEEGRKGWRRECQACGRVQRRRERPLVAVEGPERTRPAPATRTPGPAVCGACGGTGWVEVERADGGGYTVGRCHHDEAPP